MIQILHLRSNQNAHDVEQLSEGIVDEGIEATS